MLVQYVELWTLTLSSRCLLSARLLGLDVYPDWVLTGKLNAGSVHFIRASYQ